MNGLARSTPARHFELRAAALLARLLRRLEESHRHGWLHRDDDPDERFPFLGDYRKHLEEVARARRRADDPSHFEAMATEVAAAAEEQPPLSHLLYAGVGGAAAVDIVVAAALVERDVRLGALVAALQAPSPSRRPCVGMLSWLLGEEADVPRVVRLLADAGIVDIENRDDPRAEQIVRVSGPVLDLIEGGRFSTPGITYWPRAGAPERDDLVTPEAVVERIDRVARLIDENALDSIIAKGPSGTGRRTTLRYLANKVGRGVLAAESSNAPVASVAGALALLTGSMLAWEVELAAGAEVRLPRPTGVPLVAVIAGRHGSVAVQGGERVATIDLPTPTAAERRRFWAGADVVASDDVVDLVSERYTLSGGTILRVADRANAVARVNGRVDLQIDDVRGAAQELGRARLEAQANLLLPLAEGIRPILGGAAAAEYEALVLRCRHREAITVAVGGTAANGLTRGVRALFTGPSGTGKTFAARALAARLHLDVYRADMATLVDKYIGETERRVDELFTRSEELDIVLLLDEGDALLTRRTDVQTSTDRYANLETDFLLQRLETYEGILVVTTNAPQLVDQAFLRRLDAIVEFTAPEFAERRAIWTLHLPEACAVPDVLLDDLARRCRFTGGQIRNAVVHAALLAVERRTPLDGAALTAAVEREYAKAGVSSPLAVAPRTPSPFENALAGS